MGKSSIDAVVGQGRFGQASQPLLQISVTTRIRYEGTALTLLKPCRCFGPETLTRTLYKCRLRIPLLDKQLVLVRKTFALFGLSSCITAFPASDFFVVSLDASDGALVRLGREGDVRY